MLCAQPGPLGVLADVAAGFERDAEWDAAPAKDTAVGCAAPKGSIWLHRCWWAARPCMTLGCWRLQAPAPACCDMPQALLLMRYLGPLAEHCPWALRHKRGGMLGRRRPACMLQRLRGHRERLERQRDRRRRSRRRQARPRRRPRRARARSQCAPHCMLETVVITLAH